ncbi:short-chain fatty acyl-CoA regulator family protein [Sphingomonadaceae bacterium jetA1]|jgi:predicted transcriptional regulator/transcriptional regulator with XRE-family HTH domain|uniref:short-chain fatty acyl-CoA regulator family protein n=1 Tax=Facivitalis istanbulensis TaxID=3075838 RepID=UPI003474BB96
MVARKTFMGVRLRRLREERRLKQVELAQALQISPSYLNQLEQNQRPLTVPILLKLNAAFGVDVQVFSDDEEARLMTDIRDAIADVEESVSLAELRELAANMPAVGRTLVALHRRYREALERGDAMAAELGEEWSVSDRARQPFEQVRDFFYARQNHVDVLDDAAERLYRDARLTPRTIHDGLITWLKQRHGITVLTDVAIAPRRFDPAARALTLSSSLTPGQRVFQMATQLAFLELDDALDRLVDNAILVDAEARRLGRIGLANYFAGALVLPYAAFLAAAQAERYDIERLGRRFGVGFETVCHRLSTLQRTGARGVPFFFVRVDRAGNISKRQSATDFHFSRVGGTCPLWNVYEAFAQPGRVLRQVAQMPDGRSYLWIARTVTSGPDGFGEPEKLFAIGLGCDLRHAGHLVYSRGLDLADPSFATPIGAGCKVCERPACPQRAFPPIGRRLAVDENIAAPVPYPVA